MSSSRSLVPLYRRLSRPIFVAAIVTVFTMVTVGSAEASIVDDLKAILQRAQQVAGQQPAQQPAPPVTGGIAGQIGPATGTTPPPSQIGYIYFSSNTSDGSGTAAQQQAFPKLGSNHCALPVGPGATGNHDYVLPTFGCKNDEIRYMGVNLKQLFPVEPTHQAGYGGMDVTDYRLGITVSLWDSSTCGATNHPFAVIKLGGDESFFNGNVQLYGHDIERTYGPELDRVTRGGGKGQLAGKISCVRIERNHRLS
jgi:hypothetical protein